jgi:hypothetical protein
MRDAHLGGPITPEPWKQHHDPVMKRIHLAEMAWKLFVVFLMVFKPF